MEFQSFPKLSRLSRGMIVTEKIDGTNAQVCISPEGEVRAGSRNRWITPESDNYGFAAWVKENETELRLLGPGRHFGEWWGRGIQRTYGLTERRFSLFNADHYMRMFGGDLPGCISVVPVLSRHDFDSNEIGRVLDVLKTNGSKAAPGFMRPEGVVIYHTAAGVSYKKTIEADDKPKGVQLGDGE